MPATRTLERPAASSAAVAPPMALTIELTHRCPLQCAYCSNPLQMDLPKNELTTAEWLDVIDQAADLGVLQLAFSGGEPMARKDHVELVARATERGLYTNLLTSAVQLTDEALARLVEAGICHIQISFQDSDAEAGDAVAGYKGAFERKVAAARRVRAAGLPLTLNFVVHRRNSHRIDAMIALGETLEPERIEIANVQYHGWALLNRDALLPTRAQLDHITAVVEAARRRLDGRIAFDYVVPDYYAVRPKACMGGWGRRILNVTPTGKALPCHAAESLPGFAFPSVREQRLADIWTKSDLFTRFRGVDWMPEPCQSCERREIDWGGCRCQAFAITGDAAVTDPACHLSPEHARMAEAVAEMEAHAGADYVPRRLRPRGHV